jgi:SAM-dependent methyltransferase
MQEAAGTRSYTELHETGRGRAVEEARERVYSAVLERFTPHGARRCLDVGAGSGVFVRMAARRGWDCVGVDPAGPDLVEPGMRLVRSAFPPAPDGPFELITFFGSLNYMREPLAALMTARMALAPTGDVVIRVPNVDVHLAVRRAVRALGSESRLRRWLVRGTIVHPRAFSAPALRALLCRAGFGPMTVEASRPAPGDPYGTGQRALGIVKRIAGGAAVAVGRASRGRVLLAPSLLATAKRGAADPRC